MLVRATDASNKQKKKETSNLHTHTHTHAPKIKQTGNSHSVKSCILHVSTQTTSSVISLVFEKFCSFVFCFCVCYLLLLDLFCFVFHCLLLTLVFGCVMTGLMMVTETLLFFFQKHHKKGRSSLCSISPKCSTAR